MKLEYIKPPLVLMIICVVVSGLLAGANALTADKIAMAEQEKINQSVRSLLGDGTFTTCTQEFEGISKVIHDDKGQVAMEITVSGYSNNGLHLMVGIDQQGKIKGIEFIEISETKGIGTKVQTDDFLSQFIGAENTDYQFDAISGATYSSKGMKTAIDTVLDVYNNNKEAILSE